MPELDARLAQLEAAELIFRSGAAPEAVYTFKHALVQDTAYESLLRSSRRRLHERIAAVLQEKFPDAAAAAPEIAAHHLTQAGLVEDAVEWWGKAGDRSLRSSAYPEAIAHLTKAIGLAEGLSESPSGQSRRLQLQIAYGNALIATRGYGAPETSVAFARARELASSLKGAPERFAATYGLWVGSLVRSELGSMQELAQAFLHDTADRPDAPEAGIAHRVCGMTRWFEGNFVDAKQHLEQAITIYRDEHDRNLAFLVRPRLRDRCGDLPRAGAVAARRSRSRRATGAAGDPPRRRQRPRRDDGLHAFPQDRARGGARQP